MKDCRTIIYRPQPNEGPAAIIVDLLAMADCVTRAECFDGATGGYFVLNDGREFRFSVDEPAGEGICTACSRDSHDCSADPCAAVLQDREAEEPRGFRNHYECDQCGTTWQDEWSCACNDKCECGAEIEPSKCEEIEEV